MGRLSPSCAYSRLRGSVPSAAHRGVFRCAGLHREFGIEARAIGVPARIAFYLGQPTPSISREVVADEPAGERAHPAGRMPMRPASSFEGCPRPRTNTCLVRDGPDSDRTRPSTSYSRIDTSFRFASTGPRTEPSPPYRVHGPGPFPTRSYSGPRGPLRYARSTPPCPACGPRSARAKPGPAPRSPPCRTVRTIRSRRPDAAPTASRALPHLDVKRIDRYLQP